MRRGVRACGAAGVGSADQRVERRSRSRTGIERDQLLTAARRYSKSPYDMHLYEVVERRIISDGFSGGCGACSSWRDGCRCTSIRGSYIRLGVWRAVRGALIMSSCWTAVKLHADVPARSVCPKHTGKAWRNGGTRSTGRNENVCVDRYRHDMDKPQPISARYLSQTKCLTLADCLQAGRSIARHLSPERISGGLKRDFGDNERMRAYPETIHPIYGQAARTRLGTRITPGTRRMKTTQYR
jgi:hypothetical protein